MAMGNNSTPYENAPAIEQAMQWILEDLLANREPKPDDLTIIPIGIATDIVEALSKAQEGGEVGIKRAFRSLCETYPWLKELRAKPVPSREGTGESKEAPKERRYALQPLSYFKNRPKREWGVDKIIFDRGTSLFIGDGGSGKSTFVLNMLLSRACGVYFIDRPTKPAFLVWVAAESADELYPRVLACLSCHNITEDQLTNFLGLDGRVPFNNVAEVQAFIEDTQEQLAERGVSPETHSITFAFDTYARCTPGSDENNTQETKIIADSMLMVASAFNGHVTTIHHMNAQGKIRGNTALRDAVDTVWNVFKDGDIIKLHCDKMRGTRESEDFTVKVRSIVIDENNLSSPDSTAPVIFPSEGGPQSEKFLPKAQMQMLEIVSSNGQLTCNQWQKLCKEAHDISSSTFYSYLKRIVTDELVNVPAEEDKERGKKVYYSLSPKGVLLLG